MIADGLAALSHNPWLAIAAAMTGFGALVALLKIVAMSASAHPEYLRKLLHVGSGLMALSFPVLFTEVWPVLILTGSTALFLGIVKFVPWWHRRLGDVFDGVRRVTLGELYFPLAVAIVFSLSAHERPLLFVIPVLVLSVADATGGLIGIHYGLTARLGSGKSLEGSLAFFVSAFLCTHVPLRLGSSVSLVESLLISATLASLLTLVEACARRGRDNLFIPVVGHFLLRLFLTVDAAALWLWFIISASLMVVGACAANSRSEARPSPPCSAWARCASLRRPAQPRLEES